MAANPDKCQAILHAPSIRETLIKPINIKDSTITTARSVKILGIEIDDKLKFNTHINRIGMSQGGSPTKCAPPFVLSSRPREQDGDLQGVYCVKL